MNRERRDLVKEILISKPFTALSELEEKFPEVSSMTLRRDIEYFESTGDVIRVRGGARAMHFINLTKEAPFYKRASENIGAKSAIAQKADEFIESGRSLYFDSGSTVLQMVSRLPDERLNITTSDPSIAIALLEKEQVNINLVGGSLSRSNLSLSGDSALAYIEKTNIDIAFISPSGMSAECGFSCGNYNESVLKNAVISKAQFVVVLVHSAKFKKSMPFTFAPISAADVLITDADPGPEITSEIERNGGRVLLAQTAEPQDKAEQQL